MCNSSLLAGVQKFALFKTVQKEIEAICPVPMFLYCSEPALVYRFSITDAYWNDLYVKPYIRCKPYLVGMLLGYILYKYGLKVRLPKVL